MVMFFVVVSGFVFSLTVIQRMFMYLRMYLLNTSFPLICRWLSANFYSEMAVRLC